MIKSLEAVNIQSHEKTKLEFSPGINTITGSSDNGKSALLRAFFWAVKNRPLGADDKLASHWIKNEKGRITGTAKVIIENGGGRITREKSPELNGYTLYNGKESRVFEAVKTEVPEEVSRFFNLSETNIQAQQDPPFLLSSSAADVARFFNRAVRLDIIDKVLGDAENARRKNKQESDTLDKTLVALKEQAGGFHWTGAAAQSLEKYERAAARAGKLQNKAARLEDETAQAESLSRQTEKIPVLNKAGIIIKTLEGIENQIREWEKRERKLYDSIQDYLYQNRMVKNTPVTGTASMLITRIENTVEKITPIARKRRRLNDSIVSYADFIMERDNAVEEALKRKQELPDTCPVCGAAINKGE